MSMPKDIEELQKDVAAMNETITALVEWAQSVNATLDTITAIMEADSAPA